MSQDDRTHDARMRDGADGVDDGTIHEWLDGELDAVRAAELEALVAASPNFAARVAEARGLLAASSRILSALDEVPGNVLPNSAATDARPMVRPRSPHAARTADRGWSARRWTGIAALLMVGVTGVVIARQEPELTRVREPVSIASKGAADAVVADAVTADTVTADTEATVAEATARVGAALDSGAAVASESLAASGLAVADAARSEPAVAQMALAPSVASAPAARSREASVQDTRVASPLAVAGGVARSQSKAAPALQQTTIPSGSARAERVADASANIASAQGSRPTVSVQGGAPVRRMLSAEGSAAFEVAPAPPSDILAGDLLLAVQRVSCAPGCVQVRVEIARDGRVRRWRQSLGSTGSPDTATLTGRAMSDLSRTVAALRLDTLPAMLRLDGAQCRSVGSLRESLRVEFVHNDELRRVMGLPWCSDGTHVMDKAAAAIEAAADSALSRVSGASSRYW